MPSLVIETPAALKAYVGKEIGASDWLVVTQERIDRFACSVECEGSDKPCCVAEWIVRYYKEESLMFRG